MRTMRGAEKPQEETGQLERAARLFGAVNRLLESTTSVLTIEDRQLYEQNLAVVQSSLSEDEFARAWDGGRSMSLDKLLN